MTADELIRLLDELATRLEGPAKYTFDLAARQVVIEALLPWGVLSVALVVGVIAGAIAGVSAYKYPDAYEGPAVWIRASGVIVVIGAASVGVCALLFGLLRLPNLLNPEWAALQRIITTLKP
jgi:hypothetical protein